jgi:hypothetical protein
MPRKDVRLTKCSICGQPALAGGRLCAPCRSALKRARDTTVSEGISPHRRARKRPPLPEANPPLAQAPPANAPRRWLARAAWAVAALGVFAGTGLWLAHTRGNAGMIAPRYSVAPPVSNGETIKAAASDASMAQAPAPAAFAASDRAGAPPLREPIDPRTMPSSIAVPRGGPSAPVPLPQISPDPGPLTAVVPEPPPAPPPVVVAQAPVPKAVPDRWQRLGEALAACPAETLKRSVCQESLRIEHCEGFWGRVAQCPARVEREYGN